MKASLNIIKMITVLSIALSFSFAEAKKKKAKPAAKAPVYSVAQSVCGSNLGRQVAISRVAYLANPGDRFATIVDSEASEMSIQEFNASKAQDEAELRQEVLQRSPGAYILQVSSYFCG